MNRNLALFLLIGGLVGPILASDTGAAAAAMTDEWQVIKKGLGRNKQKSPDLISKLDKIVAGEAHVRELSHAKKVACSYCNDAFRSGDLESRITHLRKCARAHAF